MSINFLVLKFVYKFPRHWNSKTEKLISWSNSSPFAPLDHGTMSREEILTENSMKRAFSEKCDKTQNTGPNSKVMTPVKNFNHVMNS